MKTPVILVVFNRPDHARQVLAAIRQARPEQLFVVADGPRPEVPADVSRCRETREAIESGLDWPCEVTRVFSETNLGCAVRLPTGVTQVFESVAEAIILEDDCLPNPSFFPYAETMLERYREDERVMSIAGSRLRPWTPQEPGGSSSFSNYFHCWGWATWARAWRHYNHDLTRWRERVSPEAIRRRLGGSTQQMRYWAKCMDMTRDGMLRAWDYRYMLSCWEHDGLTVIPRVNLIQNTGFGEWCTHTTGGQKNPCESTEELHDFSPAAPGINWVYDRQLREVHRGPSFLEKVRRRLERAIGHR